jgi:hypothetical protein
VIGFLSDEHHERLWRICDALVSGAGARAAMICDTSNGEVLVSVGDTSATGAVSAVDALGPGERLVRGEAGQIYGVDVPGGALLAVLHEVGALESVRALAAEAVHDTAELLASLAPAGHDHDREHDHARETQSARAPRKKPPPRYQASGLGPQASGSRKASSAPSRKSAARKPPPPKRKPVAKRNAASRNKKGPARKLKPSRKRRR